MFVNIWLMYWGSEREREGYRYNQRSHDKTGANDNDLTPVAKANYTRVFDKFYVCILEKLIRKVGSSKLYSLVSSGHWIALFLSERFE